MKTEWLSVKERLPDSKVQSLIYDEDVDRVVIGVFLYSKPSFPVFGIWGEGQIFSVTHWMPLPEPPKQ